MSVHEEKTEKKQFRYRKAQWRRRTISLLSKMRKALDDVDKSQNLPQNFYDMAADLEGKGKQGEKHLQDVDSLDFFPFVKYDIAMMLWIISLFSQHFVATTKDSSLVTYYVSSDYVPSDKCLDHQVDWSIHTRRQFIVLKQYLLQEGEENV